MLNKSQIFQLLQRLDENTDLAETELNYTNNFTLLLAVVLSAQAKDSSVNIATRELFTFIKEPQDIIALGEEELKDYIRSIGLYKTKAKNIMLLSTTLIAEFDSKVPNNFDDLVSLAGVGRKTANVILNVAFKQDTMPVDTHVFRLSHRLGLSKGKIVQKVEEDLLKKIPHPFRHKAHHLFILHGRYVCKAKGYNCSACCVKDICEFKSKKFL